MDVNKKLEEAILAYVETHGWESFMQVVREQWGFTLVSQNDTEEFYQKGEVKLTIRKVDEEE